MIYTDFVLLIPFLKAKPCKLMKRAPIHFLTDIRRRVKPV